MNNDCNIDVECLIISHSLDYSTDLICFELKKRNIRYLRLNRDKFSGIKISVNPAECSMRVALNSNLIYHINNSSLSSIYFRAPVFLRAHKNYSLEEQLYRSQWSSFIRNLVIFENALWINHPVSTYKAENKIYQLKKAKDVGLDIPQTIVSNHIPCFKELKYEKLAVKSLDTALFYDNMQELFVYTQSVLRDELTEEQLKIAPVIMQELLEHKIDIRVTVIGKNIYPVRIFSCSVGVIGDWRREKKNLSYEPFELPEDIKKKILQLMEDLGLEFGGVDFIYANGKYYFVEVNPTGEWGWLTRTANIDIDKKIANLLCSNLRGVPSC
ncbi:MAG: hypothetical protein PHN64_02265 [Desulfovibrionaceae bacterium]|nr:hypothetical protein [Desulfovibrionaceae bacterium]